MSPGDRRDMIKPDHPKLSLSAQCRVLNISRSTLYFRPLPASEETLALMKSIDKLFTKYPFFGSRQIAVSLARDGVKAGRHRVRRLMRLMGLEAVYKRPKTSQPHPAHPVFPYLLKGMEITRPNQVWCSDITFDGKSILDRFLLRLTPRQPGLSLPRRHHGLGNAQGAELAVVEYDACRLLCRCAERGHRKS